MSVYVLIQVSCYIFRDEIWESNLCTSYTLRLARKHVPVHFFSKESNKNLWVYLIKHRNRGVVGDLQVSLEPRPPFSSSCQCLYYCKKSAGSMGGAHRHLSVHFPPHHSFAPWVSWQRSSSEKVFFPQRYPKCSNSFEGRERKREGEQMIENTKEKEQKWAISRGYIPLPGSRGTKGEVSFCLPFCHSQRKPTHLLSLSGVGGLWTPGTSHPKDTASYHCSATWKTLLPTKWNEVSQWEGHSLELQGTESSWQKPPVYIIKENANNHT